MHLQRTAHAQERARQRERITAQAGGERPKTYPTGPDRKQKQKAQKQEPGAESTATRLGRNSTRKHEPDHRAEARRKAAKKISVPVF